MLYTQKSARSEFYSLFLYIFIFIRLINFISSFPVKVGGDSISYRAPAIPQELPWYISPFEYFPNALWGGAQRPALPVTVFFFAGSDTFILVLLTFISIFSWLYLAKTLYKLYFSDSSVRRQLLFFIAFIVISCSPEVLVWNRLIYSESLALSSFAIFLASSLDLVNKSSKNYRDLTIWTVSMFFVATTRIDQMFIAFISVFGIFFLRKFKSSFSKIHKLVAALTLIVILLYNFSAVKSWDSQVSRPLVTLSYYLSTDSSLSTEVVEFLNTETNIPECARIPKVYPGGTQLEWSLPFKKTCVEAISWAEETVPKMYLYLVSNHPAEFMQQLTRTVIAGSRYYPYLSGISSLPEPLHNLVFPSFSRTHDIDAYEVRPGVNSFFTFEPLFIIAFLAIFIAQKSRKHLSEAVLLWGVAISLSLSWLATASLLPGPDSESYRLAIVPNVFLRLCLLLILHLYFIKEKNAKKVS